MWVADGCYSSVALPLFTDIYLYVYIYMQLTI